MLPLQKWNSSSSFFFSYLHPFSSILQWTIQPKRSARVTITHICWKTSAGLCDIMYILTSEIINSSLGLTLTNFCGCISFFIPGYTLSNHTFQPHLSVLMSFKYAFLTRKFFFSCLSMEILYTTISSEPSSFSLEKTILPFSYFLCYILSLLQFHFSLSLPNKNSSTC